jgi:hypothetical protein
VNDCVRREPDERTLSNTRSDPGAPPGAGVGEPDARVGGVEAAVVGGVEAGVVAGARVGSAVVGEVIVRAAAGSGGRSRSGGSVSALTAGMLLVAAWRGNAATVEDGDDPVPARPP